MEDLKAKKRKPNKFNPEALLKKFFSKKEWRHIKFNYLRRGIIGIKVNSSTRLYALSLQKEDLLNKLRKKSPGIKDIRFRLGEIK